MAPTTAPPPPPPPRLFSVPSARTCRRGRSRRRRRQVKTCQIWKLNHSSENSPPALNRSIPIIPTFPSPSFLFLLLLLLLFWLLFASSSSSSTDFLSVAAAAATIARIPPFPLPRQQEAASLLHPPRHQPHLAASPSIKINRL